MLTILIASSNPGKLREIHAILAQANRAVAGALELLLPAQLGLNLDVAENGATYAENAALKARAYCHASGLVTLADDSGLEVDALGGAPGLYSARYAPGTGATDADHRAYLLQNLRGHPQPWTARFVCALALAQPGGSVDTVEGFCAGQVTPQERGSGGFGYDRIFLLPEYGQTMAELPEAVKNQISHRAHALQAAVPLLRLLAQ